MRGYLQGGLYSEQTTRARIAALMISNSINSDKPVPLPDKIFRIVSKQ